MTIVRNFSILAEGVSTSGVLGVANGGTGVTTKTGTGSVVLSDSPTITTLLTASGQLNFTGSATLNQYVATNQTTGPLTIGGSTATGTTNIAPSNNTQTINIANGSTTAGKTKTINIGDSGLASSLTNISIGSTEHPDTTSVYINGASFFATSIGQNIVQVGTLPTSVSAGDRNMVDDALATTFGAIVIGGGGNVVPVYYDGTNWRIG